MSSNTWVENNEVMRTLGGRTIHRVVDKDDVRWYYLDGEVGTANWMPSVTEILGIVVAKRMKQYFVKNSPQKQEKVLEATGDFGMYLHSLIEADLKDPNYVARTQVRPDAATAFGKWLELKAKHNVRLVDANLTELPVFHDLYGYAGTLDLVANIDGVKTLADIKTGYVDVKVSWQLEAYRQAYHQMTGEWLPTATISVPRRDEFDARVFKVEHNDWCWTCFQSTWNVWRGLNFHKLDKMGWTWLKELPTEGRVSKIVENILEDEAIMGDPASSDLALRVAARFGSIPGVAAYRGGRDG